MVLVVGMEKEMMDLVLDMMISIIILDNSDWFCREMGRGYGIGQGYSWGGDGGGTPENENPAWGNGGGGGDGATNDGINGAGYGTG
jgi:hypothetical protein